MRKVLPKGHPIYNEPAKRVEDDKEANKIIMEMIKVLFNHRHFVGLACNQIGFNKRIIIVDTEDTCEIMINPEIIEQSGEQETFEGCGSLDKYTFYKLKRPQTIKVRYEEYCFSEYVEKEFHGKDAWIVCHEIDHLDGIFIDDKAEQIFRGE